MLPPPPGPGDNCPFLKESPAPLEADRSHADHCPAKRKAQKACRGKGVSSTWHMASQSTHNWPLDLESSPSLRPPSKGTKLSALQAHTVSTF